VDIDLEKCFDRINHDILMGRIAKRIRDKRILRLIRHYLQAEIMVHGVVQERYQGTPQGGPLSPLLSNILLDELDRNWKYGVISSAATLMTVTSMFGPNVPASG